MASHKFIGVTARINVEENTSEKLTVLAQAVESLQLAIKPVLIPNPAVYEAVTQSEAYQYLQEHCEITYVDECNQPAYTPALYNKAGIIYTERNDVEQIVLFIPTNTKDTTTQYQFVYPSLIPTITALFGEAVQTLTTFEAYEHETFAQGKTTHILPVTA